MVVWRRGTDGIAATYAPELVHEVQFSDVVGTVRCVQPLSEGRFALVLYSITDESENALVLSAQGER